MLILTRKPGESLYIGHVKVTIVEIKGHQIRIGIDAPKEIRIYREEIYLQIMEENKKAAEAALAETTNDLEGLTAAWENRPGEGAAHHGEEGADKPKLGGLSSFTTNAVTAGAKNVGGADPEVVVRRKRGKKPNE